MFRSKVLGLTGLLFISACNSPAGNDNTTASNSAVPASSDNMANADPMQLSARPATLLDKTLELGVATKEVFYNFREAGGLTAQSNWHGITFANINTEYDHDGKLKDFLGVVVVGTAPRAIMAAASAYCGFQDSDWKRTTMGDFMSGSARNAKCDARYQPQDERNWLLVVAVPSSDAKDEAPGDASGDTPPDNGAQAETTSSRN